MHGRELGSLPLPAACLAPFSTALPLMLPSALQWAASQAATPGSPLFGRVDTNKIVLSGHSRGGKLAALVFAGARMDCLRAAPPGLPPPQPCVEQQLPTCPLWRWQSVAPAGKQSRARAAYLIDPVDVTQFSPVSADNPSAAAALQQAGRPVGITAASIIGSCNPASGGYQAIWPAVPAGSWLGVQTGASHASVRPPPCPACHHHLPAAGQCTRTEPPTHPPFPFPQYLDSSSLAALVCGAASITHAEALRLTTPAMLAWYWRQLNGGVTPQASCGGWGKIPPLLGALHSGVCTHQCALPSSPTRQCH